MSEIVEIYNITLDKVIARNIQLTASPDEIIIENILDDKEELRRY